MSPTKNYATYRDTIRNMAPPCVPFVGKPVFRFGTFALLFSDQLLTKLGWVT